MSELKMDEVLVLVVAKLKEHDSRLQSLAGQVEEVKKFMLSGVPQALDVKDEAWRVIGESRSILVVDEDTCLVDILKPIMEKMGFKVDTANNGINALFKVSKSCYDMMIFGEELPDMLGDELSKRIRQRSPDTEVVMVKGYRSDSEPKKEDARKVRVKSVPAQDIVEMVERTITSGEQG